MCFTNRLRLLFICLIASFSILLAAPAFATTTISTFPYSNNGVGNVVDSGQTFTIPAGTDLLLHDYSYACLGAGATTFRTQVFQFDSTTNKVIGPSLYTSGPVTPSQTFPYTIETFTPLSPILVLAGAQYIAVIEQGGYGNAGNIQLALSRSDYTGGRYLYTYGTSPYTTDSFSADSNTPNMDVGFTATLVGVPEPSMLAMGGAILLTIGLRRVRGRYSLGC